MATVINNPGGPTTTDSSNAVGTALALILLLALVFALVYYGIPSFRSSFISIPRSVDVNVNTPSNGNTGGDTTPQQ